MRISRGRDKSSRCKISKVVIILFLIPHTQQIRGWCGCRETPKHPSTHSRRFPPSIYTIEIISTDWSRGWWREPSTSPIIPREIIPQGSKRVNLAGARQHPMEAHRPRYLTQPRYLGCSWRPRCLWAANNTEKVIEISSGCSLLVAMRGCPHERDVVEWKLGPRSRGEIKVQGVTGINRGESTVRGRGIS